MATAKSKSKVKEEKEETPEETAEEILEVIQPSAEPREWTIGVGETKRTYTQKPLSFLQKARLGAHIGGTLRSTIAASDAGSISEVLSGGLGAAPAGLTSQDFQDAEAFINLATSLSMYVPDFLEQATCIILNVPNGEKALAIENLNKNEDDGGLSDSDFIELINVFIVQNWGAIEDLFRGSLQETWKLAKAQRQAANEDEA